MNLISHNNVTVIYGNRASGRTKLLTMIASQARAENRPVAAICIDIPEFKAQLEGRFPSVYGISYIAVETFEEAMTFLEQAPEGSMIVMDDFDYLEPHTIGEQNRLDTMRERVQEIEAAAAARDYRVALAVKSVGSLSSYVPTMRTVAP